MPEDFENHDSPNVDDINVDPDVDVQKLIETNKKLYARAKTAEGFVQDSSGNWVKKEKPQNLDKLTESKPLPTEDVLWDMADYIREGYNRKDVEFIMANGGRKALEDPNSHVSIALRAIKEQRTAEQQAAKTSDASGLTEVERKYTLEQLKNMPKEELAKILPHA